MNLQTCFRTTCRRVVRAAVAFALIARLAPSALAQRGDDRASPLTLRSVLDAVLATHPTLRAADGRIRAAAGSLVTARTFGNPVIAYQVDQTPFPGGQPLPADMRREAMATATVPLEFLYQRGPRVTRATADARAAEADAAGIRQRLALDAAFAYYRVALAQVRSATTHDLLRWLDTLAVYNRSRVREGAVAEADLIRSELERDRVAAAASMQDADLARARATLSSFLGEADSAHVMRTVLVDDTPLPLTTPSGMSALGVAPSPSDSPASAMIDARPDIRAAHERVAATGAAMASERSMLIRQLGATIGTMQTNGSTSMIAGISVPIPLFDQNRGEIQRARAERDVATAELAADTRVAGAEVRGEYEGARLLTDRAMLLARRDSNSFLARAEESRRIALGAYREGAVPLFQVIDAARSWAEARNTYFETITAQHQSVLALLVATGVDLFAALPNSSSNGTTRR
jgi:cobalt-zinc-cadmium efflux system outer membrane protein